MSELTLEQQIQELAVAHQMLTDRGLDSRSVCYPYGAFNADTLAAVSSLGYQVGLKLAKRPVQGESALELNRIVVSFSDSLPKLLYKIYVRPHLP
jgi:peptidoglycan/xylan/chitin deacetylase (PgdA/CDA1 family)